jgi:hypothetical protein
LLPCWLIIVFTNSKKERGGGALCPLQFLVHKSSTKMGASSPFWLSMFKLSTNKCYNEWFKSIEQILNVLFKYKPKRNVGLLWHFKMTCFHSECQNPIKTSNNVLFLAPMSPTSFQTFGM